MLACALVGRTGLCSSPSILISELGSVPSYLRDTTSAIFPLSPLHQFLSQIIPLVHKHDIISLILKQKLETLFHPGSSASCASTFFNNKIAVKNCLYICRLQALFFLWNSFHDTKSKGCFFVVCRIRQPITSSFLKCFLPLASRILHQLSAFLSAIHLVSYWFLLTSIKTLVWSMLKLTEGFIYAHSLGNLTSSLGFKYYDMLTPP